MIHDLLYIDALDGSPPPRESFAVLTDHELGRYIDDYARMADSGMDLSGVLLVQRDLDVIQNELREMRAERERRRQ